MSFKLKGQFVGPSGRKWKILHGPAKKHPRIFECNGKKCIGIAYFKGRFGGRIYIDNSQSDTQIWDTTIHELLHVCLQDLNLLYVIEEPIVDETASRLAAILEQL